MRQLRMELNVPATATMGSTEKIKLTVDYKLPVPPYNNKISITKPLTGEHWRLNSDAKLPTEHCGELRVQLYKPGVFDHLGIFRLKVRKAKSETVLILPEPVEMEVPPNLHKHMEPRWRRKPGGGYAENHEIRQYQPGDNLNQIHWKLSAKVGELMIREPMVQERGLMLLTMDLNGTGSVLDRKLGQLLWLSQWLREREIVFEIRVLTGKGIQCWTIGHEEDVDRCILSLLSAPLVRDGSIRDVFFMASWRHHIGGEQDEA